MCGDGICESDANGVSRRRFLQAATVAGAAGALTLGPMRFASAATGKTATQTISGHLPTGVADFVYLPVEVPRGVQQIDVQYTYDKPTVPAGVPANSCDIGIFDERGYKLGGRGFRGWSGGFRTSFSISASDATPGYLPGPVNAGTWNVILGPYQVAPQGLNYQVTVTLTYGPAGKPFRPNYPPTKAPGRGKAWYRGDCHLHTVYSDGKRLPSDVATAARAGKLDFMVSTDHNTTSSHAVWGEYAGDDLLIILGEEITTRNGHCLGLGLRPGHWIDWRYRARDDVIDKFVHEIHSDGGLFVPAHPYCPYIACQWKFGYAQADLAEVWNGPWTSDDDSAVDTWDAFLIESVRTGGKWLPAMGNSDAHSEPQVVGLPHNVVLADGLNRDDLFAGLRAGHSWLAESAGVDLTFTASAGSDSVGIGDRLPVRPDTPVTVRLDVSGVPNGTVRFITDEGQMHQESLPAGGSGTVTWATTASLAAYVRAEVRHPFPDGSPGQGNTMGPNLEFSAMAAMTNPIFLGRR
jgi:hypothetical protein